MTKTTNDMLIGRARKGLAASDAGNWEAAEAMAELAARGMSHRDIATKVGCGYDTARRYIAIANSDAQGGTIRPPFAEAMAVVRGDRSGEKLIPKTPEKRAALAAELLKDKSVYETPAVRETVRRHSEREVRQAAQAWNRDHDVQTRTTSDRERRRMSLVSNRAYWTDLLRDLELVNRKLNDAAGELERSGLPQAHAGDIIKAARAVSRSADRFLDVVEGRAVGSAM